MADFDISSTEYQAFLAERDRIKKAMEGAESEFMFQTYKQLLAVMNKRYEAATKLNILIENRQTREMAAKKRESFKTTRDSQAS